MERDSVKERIKYLDIAKGSAAEFLTQAHIGHAINYIKPEKVNVWLQTGEKLLGMLSRLQQNLKTRHLSQKT